MKYCSKHLVYINHNFLFVSVERYKTELDKIRSEQKEMIKNKTAAVSNQQWSVNGSASAGKR